ncbi:MarR family winged helix-turn-helix transcriptional regulator [Melioribacteraceae bacterium 4301-Me]|uniref:MarR family winged helix-turn-helix transcriptional regulator n=1 Tax=Pyranulibacter aquaticus TaxID=3163344 RepID=UPI0035981262
MQSPFHLEQQNISIDSRIVASLERISEAFRVLFWNESKKWGLSPIQLQILIFICTHSNEKCNITYLAKEFNMTKATISDAVKSLEEKSLIKRKINPNDYRSHSIELTTEGKKTVSKASYFANELEKSISSLNTNDKENLLLSLIDIIYNLTAAGVITVQRMCLTCIHYSKDEKSGEHFCKLLNKKLKNSELRIDCPEHSFAK